MGWLLYRKQTDTHIPAGWIQDLNVAVFIEFSHGVKHKEFSHAVCVCVCVCVRTMLGGAGVTENTSKEKTLSQQCKWR